MAPASRSKQHSPGGIPDAAGRGLHSTVPVGNTDEHGTKGTSLQLVLGPVQCHVQSMHPPDSHVHLVLAHQAAGLSHSTVFQALKNGGERHKKCLSSHLGQSETLSACGPRLSLGASYKAHTEELCRPAQTVPTAHCRGLISS